jgi:hypothetical protein
VTPPIYNQFLRERRDNGMAIDDKTRTELEAAVFRRLVQHLRSRTDVQNIELMNLAGFCRNCLSNWLKEEADAKAMHQAPASPEQLAEMKKSHGGH